MVGRKSEITFDDLNELKYTGCCIKETLRLWPPAPSLLRSCNKNLKSKYYLIPAGTSIMVNSFNYH